MKTAILKKLLVLGTLCTAAISSTAQAASGYVSGKLMFWQAQGNYCPAGRDCSGANYREADFDVAQPVREVQVQVVDQDMNVLGASTSDLEGDFIISWYSPSLPASAKILWKARHKEQRFEVVSAASGGIYYFTSGSFSLVNGTSTSVPQKVGNIVWGSSAAPSSLANLYDGAHRTWHYALSYSGLMNSVFTDVTIKAYDSVACPTSCARGSTKTITIDSTGSAFMPQGRIMHEMGHIASYLSQPFRGTGAYDWPNQCTSCGGWSLTAQEWKVAGFEEAMATFIGDVSIYWHWAQEPVTCLSSSACGINTFNTENSTVSGCASGEHRWPLTSERYLWDVYDSIDDPNYTDTVHIEYWQFFTTLSQFGAGTSNHQADEAWNSDYSAVDAYDGRSAEDFEFNLMDRYAVSSSAQRLSNCSP
jgi:hypothetical protein